MGRKRSNLIYLDVKLAERAQKKAAVATRALVYDGALSEFKLLITPEIKKLLAAKNSTTGFQKNIVDLLEKLYAVYHLQPLVLDDFVLKLNAIVNGG